MNESVSNAGVSAPALSRTLLICNQRGLHARAAARFVKCADQFDAEITVTKKDITLDYVIVPDPSTNPKESFLPPYDSVQVPF